MAAKSQSGETEETSINEEIDENLSISEHISVGSLSDNPSVSNERLTNIQKKRNLFDIDNDDDKDFDGNIASSFKFDDSNLDALLSGGNIAQHFIVTEESEHHNIKSPVSHKTSDHDNDSLDAALNEFGSLVQQDVISPMPLPDAIIDDINEAKNSKLDEKQIESLENLDKSSNIIDDLKINSDLKSKDNLQQDIIEKDSSKNAFGSGVEKVSPQKSQSINKEISPFKDDVILINNEKISIKSLKIKQNDDNSDEFTLTTNQNTTNDVSDIGIDECSSYPINNNNPKRFTKSVEDSQRNSIDIIVEQRNCKSLDDDKVKLANFISSTNDELNKNEDQNEVDNSIEEDHSIEELIVSNASIEHKNNAASDDEILNVNQKLNIDTKQNLSDINNELEMNRILNESILNQLPDKMFVTAELIDSLDSNISIDDLKERILQNAGATEINKSKLVKNYSLEEHENNVDEDATIVGIKSMEHAHELHEALDDITEESDVSDPKVYSIICDDQKEIHKPIETNIPTDIDELAHNSFDSVVSLNMLQHMENKVKELQEIVQGKDLCLAALNMQLESCSRRDSLRELPPSGRDSCSLATSSTEYRTYQDDYVTKVFDFQAELIERDNLIDQLTASLQQSMHVREHLQNQGDKLSTEVSDLRKQLSETLDQLKKPTWFSTRDQESVGQRISEISIDLVSESDDAAAIDEILASGQPTDYCEDKSSNRNSRERQYDIADIYQTQQQLSNVKQIEQFQKYLSPDELRIFFMIQRKFDDYLSQEVEKIRGKYENDVKLLNEQAISDKHDKDSEINRLRNLLASVKSGSTELLELRRELDGIHSREMENLRTYFEKKCADLEKQYSEEIFSQHSRRHSNDTGSELSDQEHLCDDHVQNLSPKRKKKGEILASPIHRKITPTGIDANKEDDNDEPKKVDEEDPQPTIDELNAFYRDKIEEINKSHADTIQALRFRLKRYECRNIDDDYTLDELNTTPPPTTTTNTNNNDSQILNEIIADYERRLVEQISLAKEDMLHMLEEQIQALLSETATDDSQWPPELILLREKFTAKSQLEIAQLQIKHEEEMERLKNDYDKQLHRKIKRHLTFDTNRDIDQIVLERDNLRELCSSLRTVLRDLAKCVTVCEVDLNNTLMQELHQFCADTTLQTEDPNLNQTNRSIDSNDSPKRRLVPDVSGILTLIEDPSLVNFVDQANESTFNLNECVERLRTEALQLLKLSENLCRKNSANGFHTYSDKEEDSCEEYDGLKNTSPKKRTKQPQTPQACSLNENLLSGRKLNTAEVVHRSSLPTGYKFDVEKIKCGPNSELNVQLNELKNRLVLSENERKQLATELAEAVSKQNELTQMLAIAKEQLHLRGEDVSEGYGISQLQSPSRQINASQTSYSDLQNTARNIINSAPNSSSGEGSVILQQVEDFCTKLDKFVEEEKNVKEDLQEQIKSTWIVANQSKNVKIDAADKQKKATLQFLEEQATEREQERDDFTKEIERLKAQLREKEKDCNSYIRVINEVEVMEQKIREMTLSIGSYEEKKHKLEVDLRASIDKIFDLREIISVLEKQMETKSKNEHYLNEKIKELEAHIYAQLNKNTSLQDEVDSLKTEFVAGYQEKILQLEEQVRNMRPSAEQSLVIDQMAVQLKEIELSLDKKTKTLESLHSAICSASCSSPSEDVSVQQGPIKSKSNSPAESPRSPRSLPLDEVQRIMEKLIKHNRAEEAAIKRIRDLEMQINGIRTSYNELQHERDILQEKMSEQILRISSLQSRLDEQRHRAEELHRQGTSDLNVRVYDLQSQLSNIQEKLTAREKQIVTLKDHLEQSKIIIDRLEAELALGTDGDQSKLNKLELDLKLKTEENQKLKEKMRNEMINKLALPDLMETMLADKNEEIDYIKEQLDAKQAALQVYLDLNLDDQQLAELQKNAKEMIDGKLSARTLSDIVSLSEYDEPDIIRKMADTRDLQAISIPAANADASAKFFTAPSLLKNESLLDYQTPSPQPRKIIFTSQTTDDKASTGERKFLAESLSLPTIIDDDGDHHKTLTDLQQKIAQLKNENHDKTEQLLKLKEKLTENSDMHLDLAAKSKLVSDLMIDKKKLQNELDELKIQLNEMIETNSNSNFKENIQQQYNDKCEECLQLSRKLEEISNENLKLKTEIELLTQQIQSLGKTIDHKDELLSKFEKNALNFAQTESRHLETINRLEQDVIDLNQNLDRNHDNSIQLTAIRDELESTKHELFDKIIDYEKCQLYLKQQAKTIDDLKDILSDSKSPRSVEDMRIQIRQEQERNVKLSNEIVQLREIIERHRETHAASPKQLGLDEIARRVEKELNYSAQLDSNILEAIDNDEHLSNSEDEKFKNIRKESADLAIELSTIKEKYEIERQNCIRLQRLLDAEKSNSTSMQEQDTNVIKAINLRLEAAISQECELQKQLEIERSKSERLTSQLLAQQRAATMSSRDSSLHLKSSPQDSPRRTPRTSDFETELSHRLNSEIKLLTAQNERERERVSDMERVIEREKIRYEKELADRKEYGERMKREMDRIIKEKESCEQELEHIQERLLLSTREIDSLETRIANFQETESRRLARRGQERIESTHHLVEIQELKLRLNYVEKERDNLQEKLLQLRGDIERSAQREAQLTTALSNKELQSNSGNNSDQFVPKQFLHQLNNMNTLIVGNSKDNRQMTETLQFLTAERQTLQQRIVDLEMKNRAFNRDELEDRANHLFGKYLRVESYRKALVHQKKYLLIVLQTYQENEAKALAMINGNAMPKKKIKSFRSAVFVVIAIERMKYIVRRWQVGRRVGTKAIFSQQMPPRRSASASTNNWVRSNESSLPGQSPPCRDRPPFVSRSSTNLHVRPLQSPGLIAECSERLENLSSRTRWS